MGVEAHGSDSDARAVAGARANIEALGLEPRLRQLDARRMDAWGMTFDAVVSDLPYGVSASLAGARMTEL
jgi:tRNA G10  N-methylase Trm11